MIVFIAGMPRAGSMWTYNVARELLRQGSWTLRPESIPKDEVPLVMEALAAAPVERQAWCIKTHMKLRQPMATSQPIRIICNIRDIRDAALSYMRFMKGDFEVCKQAAIGMIDTSNYYANAFKDQMLTVRYEDIGAQPQQLLAAMDEWLGSGTSPEQQHETIEKYSRGNVQKLIGGLDQVSLDARGGVQSEAQQAAYDSVENLDGSYRVFDRATSFQTNHITSKQDGEWRTALDAQQRETLQEITHDWLASNGYSTN